MEFKDIEKLAMTDQPFPGRPSLIEEACYIGLRGIYREYRAKAISREHAQAEKRLMKASYESWKKQDELNTELFAQQQDRIRTAETMVSQIVRGVNAGEDVQSLYVKCMRCIGALVGNDLIMEVVQRGGQMNGEKDDAKT